MAKDIQREAVYLAALLHDIGKFFQRADDSGVKNSKLLSDKTKNLEDILCPKSIKEYYTHKHVLYTSQFFEDFSAQIKKLIDNNDFFKGDNSLELLASSHHLNKDSLTDLQKIIQLADHFSSGVDRVNDPDSKAEAEDAARNWDNFKRKRMYSIFEGISDAKHNHELPLCELNLSNSGFPQKNFDENPDYITLWKNFCDEVKNIQTNDFSVFSETLLNLLNKYAVNIPSTTMHLRDVSLYDHLKTTAAFAVCIYDVFKEGGGFDGFNSDNNSSVLMIGADISGIQSFIYDIVSKHAAKNLKGRSFYLQLLIDSVLNKILNELNLYRSNIVYSSGGSFYLLAPNTEFVRSKFDDLRTEISKKILKHHNTGIFIAMDYEEISKKQIFKKQISDCWKNLSEKLNEKKRRRYADMFKTNYDVFFEAVGDGGKKGDRDSITGEELNKDKEQIKVLKDITVNKSTWEQIELGKKLKDTDYIISSDNQIKYWEKKNKFNPCDLGIFHYLLTKEDLEKKKEVLKGSYDNIRAILINDFNFLDNIGNGIDNIYGFDFYGGNKYPQVNNDVNVDGALFQKGDFKPFSLLAGEDENSFKRLGILRMDVDNLGLVFQQGFDENKRTFSRYSSLSRNLDFFFKGYITKIWEKEKYKDYTFILYSGGDDLFIVGRWDKTIELAKEIRNEFKKWVCNSKKLTLSGGIALMPGKFPILKAAKEAEKAEKLAKDHIVNGVEKNAFTLFDCPLNWDIEFPLVENLKEKIATFIKNNELPKGFISRIANYHNNANIKDNEITNLKILWMMAYDFARMKSTIKNDEAKNFVEQCKNDVFTNCIDGKKHEKKYHTLELLNIAARWAELEIRTNI